MTFFLLQVKHKSAKSNMSHMSKNACTMRAAGHFRKCGALCNMPDSE